MPHYRKFYHIFSELFQSKIASMLLEKIGFSSEQFFNLNTKILKCLLDDCPCSYPKIYVILRLQRLTIYQINGNFLEISLKFSNLRYTLQFLRYLGFNTRDRIFLNHPLILNWPDFTKLTHLGQKFFGCPSVDHGNVSLR